MKFPVFFLSALAGLILNVASSLKIRVAAENGKSEMERIVGGREAVAGQFPWTAALYRDGSFLCTCSIIGPRTVLTAAHCVVSNGETNPASSFHAIANLRRSSPQVRIQFNRVTPHPEYSESDLLNDIAILNATQPIQFSRTVQPICIARSDTDPKEYENVLAMGWGDTQRWRAVPILPEVLNYVEQDIAGSEECEKFYGGSFEPSQICGGDTFSGICNGDSGGPLVLPGATPVQIGIASYGNLAFGCGFLAPSVWTRVSYYSGFIRVTADGDRICEF